RVGTSSLRRRAQLLARKPGLNVVDIRGNIDTRVAKVLDKKEMDAAILACAGLERIGQTDAIAEVLPADVMLPAAGQGALGIQARADDDELLALLEKIHDAAAAAETAAERTMLAALGGGCQVPIGALARAAGDSLTLHGCVCSLDGTQVLRTEVSGNRSDAESLGNQAAENLLASGAKAIVAELI
ncbi:MAG: hydroxymethylbilane synthase, partial [Candidatus Hydrogenedentes bacterium]|nr:hydroxymethylbilane synthase [Candidatus Hydrogenedentota bacterium]